MHGAVQLVGVRIRDHASCPDRIGTAPAHIQSAASDSRGLHTRVEFWHLPPANAICSFTAVPSSTVSL